MAGREQYVIERKPFNIVREQIPPHLKKELLRDFSESEKQRIYARIHMHLAPSNPQPAVLWVFGPPAVGKSSLTAARAAALFGSPQNAVVVDGAEFREVHAGWQTVLVHGMVTGCLHADAWPAFKAVGKEESGDGISGQLKSRIVSEAIRDRKHLVIPESCNQPKRLQSMIDEMIAAGYEMHAACLWAPLSVTAARGEPRSVHEGKVFSAKDYPNSPTATGG